MPNPRLQSGVKTNKIEVPEGRLVVPDFEDTHFLKWTQFCYRDGHQFTGLMDSQARSENALDFAYNASLTVVNIVKLLRKETGTKLSIGQIKSVMVNAYIIKRFFDVSGLDPHKTLNAKLVKELFGFAVDAA